MGCDAPSVLRFSVYQRGAERYGPARLAGSFRFDSNGVRPDTAATQTLTAIGAPDMPDQPIQTGDIVQLILGGPVMLVKVVNAIPEHETEAICLWFTDDGQLQEKSFPANFLIPAKRRRLGRRARRSERHRDDCLAHGLELISRSLTAFAGH